MWDGCEFALEMAFSNEYPTNPPIVKFLPVDGCVLWHLNVWTSGRICLNILLPAGNCCQPLFQPRSTALITTTAITPLTTFLRRKEIRERNGPRRMDVSS